MASQNWRRLTPSKLWSLACLSVAAWLPLLSEGNPAGAPRILDAAGRPISSVFEGLRPTPLRQNAGRLRPANDPCPAHTGGHASLAAAKVDHYGRVETVSATDCHGQDYVVDSRFCTPTCNNNFGHVDGMNLTAGIYTDFSTCNDVCPNDNICNSG